MIKVIKRNNIALGVVILMLATAATASTVTVNASATVDNAIDMTFTGDLGFGTIRANVGDAVNNCVGLVLDADPNVTTLAAASTETTFATNCTAPGTSDIISIDGAISRPEFTITGVPAFQVLTMSAPDDTELVLTGNPPNAAKFQLIDFSAFQTSGTPGAVTFGNSALTADNDGSVVFSIGAVLATDHEWTATLNNYQDSAYSGSFDVTVEY